MSRYRRDTGPSREQLAQQAMEQLGYDYMHGNVSVVDIQALLLTDGTLRDIADYHHEGTIEEALKLIARGVESALYDSETHTWIDAEGNTRTGHATTPVVESRRQPEQDAADLAAIYPNGVKNAKKLKKYDNGAIPKLPVRYAPTQAQMRCELIFTR